MSLTLITRAIEAQMPISFTCNNPEKTSGQRIGNPHAVWVLRKKDGAESTKVHVFQTDGAYDIGQELPSFRIFDLSEIDHVVMLDNHPQFDPAPEYNPEWSGYTFVITMV